MRLDMDVWAASKAAYSHRILKMASLQADLCDVLRFMF